jgi:competence protein ComEC
MKIMNYTKKRILVTGILFSFLGVFFFSSTTLALNTSSQTTTFINVGQGDSALLSDGNGFNVLIDGGKPDAGPGLVSYLHNQGVTYINVMVASHADSDHIGGLINVLNDSTISVGQVLYNGYPGTTATWTVFANAVTAKGLTLTTAQFPQVFTWGNMTAHVMNPVAGLSSPETNAVSVVVLIDYVSTKYLFTGDIDSTIEATIVARGTPIAADILKVAHHGSAYSSGDPFLAADHPKDDVISVGVNSYGHPSPLTISRLEAAGGNVWRTDLSGNITVNNSGTTYSIFPQFITNDSRIFIPYIRKDTAQPTPTPVTPTPVTPTPVTPTPVTPTATPTAPPNPTGANVQCTTAGATQICAWVSTGTPAQYGTVAVYGRLYINNVAQVSQTMNTTWHYKSTTVTCSGTTDANGTASCNRSIGAASKGYQVNVDVNIGGYSATTWFTPN